MNLSQKQMVSKTHVKKPSPSNVRTRIILKNTLISVAAAGLLLVIAAFTFTVVFLPGIAKHRIEREITTQCPACEFDLGEIRISLFRQSIALQNLHYRGDRAQPVYVELKIKNLLIPFELTSAIRRHPFAELGALQVNGLAITVFEDERNHAPPSPKDSSHWLSALPVLRFQSLSLSDAGFCYTNITRDGRTAPLHVSGIRAIATGLATRAEISPVRLAFVLTGILEKSGAVYMASDFDLYAEHNHDHLHMRVHDADLSELNPLFSAMADMSLVGMIHAVEANMTLIEGYLTGSMTAAYRDLRLTQKQTRTQGAFTVFLKNWLQAIMISKTRPRNNADRPRSAIAYQRRRNDGLIKLFLKGLVPAVKNILTG